MADRGETIYGRITRLSHEAHQNLGAAAHNAGWNEEVAQELLSRSVQQAAERDGLLRRLGISLDEAVERYFAEGR